MIFHKKLVVDAAMSKNFDDVIRVQLATHA